MIRALVESLVRKLRDIDYPPYFSSHVTPEEMQREYATRETIAKAELTHRQLRALQATGVQVEVILRSGSEKSQWP